MSKVLIVTNHSYMLYRFRLELIQTLRQRGHEVVLSMPFVGHEDDFQAMGLRCIRTAAERRGIDFKADLALLKTYRKMLKSERPDMVITYSIKPNIYMGFACAEQKIPYCANVQGIGAEFRNPVLAGIVTGLYRSAFRSAKTVFFENSANAAEFVRRHIMRARKQTLLHGAGVNLKKYPCCPYPKNDVFHFLYLGRIMREKGVGEIFDAVERLHEKYPGRFVLDLVGFFEDAYQERVKELEKAGAVKFHGFQSEPCPYYQATDCVVLPSYHEGMSNVLLEAAAIGRPLITTDIPGCREAVDDGRTGYLCTVQDAQSVYERMEQMLLLPREERANMGRWGREKMEREFAKELVVESTIRAIFG